jgi:hypothetical protein
MVAGEEMMQEQLNRIIARTELRIEQWTIHTSRLAPYGNEAKSARRELAGMLAGVAKLKVLAGQML